MYFREKLWCNYWHLGVSPHPSRAVYWIFTKVDPSVLFVFWRLLQGAARSHAKSWFSMILSARHFLCLWTDCFICLCHQDQVQLAGNMDDSNSFFCWINRLFSVTRWWLYFCVSKHDRKRMELLSEPGWISSRIVENSTSVSREICY
jgi:hypothetical protein